ncbi:MAG: glycoside hydrolase family 16 protein [Bacilli bacterium]|jgi:hypothetical protein|nr:glycoside hydrolase family 16 protein [Bacilli bacterium]
MKPNKKPFALLISALAFLPLAACGEASSLGSSAVSSSGLEPDLDDTPFNGTAYYDHVNTRVGFDAGCDLNIDEELSGGALNDDYWNALSGVWQNDATSYPHNGVQARNLYYVKDGDETYLGIKGRGMYSSSSDSKVDANGYILPEGGCLISKNHLAPGRYEIDMAAMPRYGGVSAMWTYLCETGNENTSQNEIDIEIGGEAEKDTFSHEWCTSWTKKTNKQTVNVDTSSLCYLNDGSFHKYTFDWYTNYNGTDKGKVDWFVDGVCIASVSGGVVTDIDMPLWIGLWFPNWTNMAAFDEDFMLVKSIKYTAFDETQYYEESRAKAGYTQVDPSMAGIDSIDYSDVKNANRLSNGDMERSAIARQDSSYMGWLKSDAGDGTSEFVSDSASGSKALRLTAAATEPMIFAQNIGSAYEGYRYRYSFAGKNVASGAGALEIHYLSRLGLDVAPATTIAIDSADAYKTYSGEITVPAKAKTLEVRLVASSGSACFDDVSLVYEGHA